jgi:hypothetical protein
MLITINVRHRAVIQFILLAQRAVTFHRVRVIFKCGIGAA